MRSLPGLSPVSRYIELKALISEAEEELSELKPILIDALCQEPGEEFIHQNAIFTLQRRKNWIYTQSIQDQLNDFASEIKHYQDEIKQLKEHAQTHALAEVESYTPVLMMKISKVL